MEAKCKGAIILLIVQLCGFIICQTEPVVNVQDANVTLGEDAVVICNYTISDSTKTLFAVQWHNSTSTGMEINQLINTLVTNTNGRYTVNTTQTDVVTLTIANTVLSDDGYYLCRIIDSTIDTGEHFGKLNVQYLKKPVLNPTELSVNATETVTFTCSDLVGVPTPITITWIKDDVTLDVSDTVKYPSFNATLTINNVNETDEGVYQCRAENDAHRGTDGKLSNTAILFVVLSTTEVPKSGEVVCSSTGLVVGMTFVGGLIIGFILCLLVVFGISKLRKSKSQVPTSNNDNQSGQAYTTYTGETDSHTYQDLQKKDDKQAVYVNVKEKKNKK